MSGRLAIGALVFMTGVAHAQSDEVGAWLERCEASVAALRGVEGRLASMFDEQRALRDAITARKAARGGGGPELQALLESSLGLESKLETALDERERLRRQTGSDCDRGIARAEKTLRRLQPGLRSGPLAQRRQVAREIQGVREQLQALNELRRVLAPPRDEVGLAWSDLPLEDAPLDGPEDLVDKADFVEDARDRLREKRKMLAALYAQSRQAKALRRAARDFVTDIQIFDESARSPQTARAGLSTEGGDSRGAADPVTGGSSAEGPITDGAGAPEPPAAGGGGEDDVDPSSQGGGFDGFDLSGSGGGSIPPSFIADPGRAPAPDAPPPDAPNAPEPESSGFDAGGLVSGVSPSFLLNLRVEELEDRNLDLATLEKLLEDMARLDDVLAARAVEMRMKAKELGRTESP